MRNAKGLINYLNYRAKGDNNCQFQDPQAFVFVSQLPAALRLPQKKHAPGFWSMYLADVVIFNDFSFQSPLRLCRSCLRRFGSLKKTRSWIAGACILWMLLIFVDFRVSDGSAVVR